MPYRLENNDKKNSMQMFSTDKTINTVPNTGLTTQYMSATT